MRIWVYPVAVASFTVTFGVLATFFCGTSCLFFAGQACYGKLLGPVYITHNTIVPSCLYFTVAVPNEPGMGKKTSRLLLDLIHNIPVHTLLLQAAVPNLFIMKLLTLKIPSNSGISQ